MDKPFRIRLGQTRSVRERGSAPDPNEVRPYGRFGVGVVAGPAGLLVVAGIFWIALGRLPEVRWFFILTLALGALVGLLLWLKHR